jgi:hypothetical protein
VSWLARHALAAVLALCAISSANAGVDSATIYVARRGWHIDVGMAAADLSAPLNQAAAPLPGSRYVFFGFADKHYLLAANHNAPVLLSALWPGAGILLTTGLTNSPAEAFGATHVITLTVPKEQMLALQSFIWRSLRTQDGVLKVFQAGPYEGSVYFLATQKYSAFHTCNTWGAEALRGAGLHVHTAGIIFAGQLWAQVRRLKRLQEPAAEPRASLLPSTSSKLQLQGGRVPSWQTTVVVEPGGTTTVVFAGGLGLPLLMQPHSIAEATTSADRIFIVSSTVFD